MTLQIPHQQKPVVKRYLNNKKTSKLEQHLHQKKINNERLVNDPALNNTDVFKESLNQIITKHESLHPTRIRNKKITAPIIILGNSFSWQGHVLSYFNRIPPTQQWRGSKVIHIPYSSSFLEPSNRKNTPYKPKSEKSKQTYNSKARKKVLSKIPRNIDTTVIDMVKTGAGLASFLKLKQRKPDHKLLAFIPDTHISKTPLNNSFFTQYDSQPITMAKKHQILLESICNDVKENPIRGISEFKIYDPPSKEQRKETLFYVKLSQLIHEVSNDYQIPETTPESNTN